MEGTDIVTTVANSSDTYFGNYCPNPWISTQKPDYGGSATACSSRIVQTEDSEDQQMGVYYGFFAAAPNTGIWEETRNNYNFPDTFCPLGWQLPYSGTGGDYYDKSKSFNFLINIYNLVDDLPGITSYPLSFIKSGFMNWSTKLLYGSRLRNWSVTNYNGASSYIMSNSLVDELGNKSDRVTIRCVTLHRRHGGKRICAW